MYFYGIIFRAKILMLADKISSMYSFWLIPIKMTVQRISIYCIISSAAGPSEEIEFAEEANSIKLLTEIKT